MGVTSLRCPKCGSASTDAEFCSECGAAMAAPPAAAPTPMAAAAAVVAAAAPAAEAAPNGATACPVCGEARPGPFARYCDTCRYDFLEKRPFAATPAPASPPAAAPAPAPPVASPAAAHWDLRASVDISLRRADDPMPSDLRERLFPLDLADHLLGRRSDSADIHPEIVINDPGVSRRHLRILRAPDGTLSLVDIGSTNGTKLNDTAVEPNVPTVLHEGDEITLGCWTRLKVLAR
jgi:ribosomal protein S14